MTDGGEDDKGVPMQLRPRPGPFRASRVRAALTARDEAIAADPDDTPAAEARAQRMIKRLSQVEMRAFHEIVRLQDEYAELCETGGPVRRWAAVRDELEALTEDLGSTNRFLRHHGARLATCQPPSGDSRSVQPVLQDAERQVS